MRVNNFVRLKHISGYISICIYAAFLSACGPNSKEQALQAEKKRIECLDKFCTGDVDPRSDYTDELLKFNGRWYVGPKTYFSNGIGGGAFYWPSKTPAFAGGDYPEKGQPFYETAIEIFLTGRALWPNPNTNRPWESNVWEQRFDELQKRGWRMERQQFGDDLERIRFTDSSGQHYRHEYFIAIKEKKLLGDDHPVIACDPNPYPVPEVLITCTGGLYWHEDVYANFRFHTKHAQDWPAIHQEIVRVLSLAKKIQS